MEEGGGKNRPANKAPEKKKKGVFHVRRGKRKYTCNARTGSEQKTSSMVIVSVNDGIITTHIPNHRPAYDAKKAYLDKTLGYKRRDKIKSVKNSKRLEHQLLIINEQHEKELAITEAKLSSKVVECNEVATLAQARRRGESKAMQMSDNKVSAMRDEMNNNIGSAKCEVQAVSADACTTVLSERLYTALVTAKRERYHKRDHKKERERQSLVHNSKIKAKDYDIAKKKEQTEKYCNVASAADAKV